MVWLYVISLVIYMHKLQFFLDEKFFRLDGV